MFLLFGILSNPDCKSYGLEYGIANPVQRGLVWKGHLETGQINLDTSQFQNGLYRILVAGKAGVKFLGFQIIR